MQLVHGCGLTRYVHERSWFILFTLVFARVGGLTMTAPIYGTSDVPLQVRVLLAAALALLIVPSQWHARGRLSGSLVQYLVLLGGEAAIGACLGLGVLILIHGMTLAGELIGQASGLGIAEVFDPTLDENVPLFSRLMFLVAVTVFLCIGGHRMVMAGLLDTFQTIPPGSGVFPGSLADGFVTLVSQSFSLGIRVAAPGRDGAAAGHADPRPDRPDAAAIEHLGAGLRPERPAGLRRPGADARRGRLGVSGSNPAGDGDDLRRPENAAAERNGCRESERDWRLGIEAESQCHSIPIPNPQSLIPNPSSCPTTPAKKPWNRRRTAGSRPGRKGTSPRARTSARRPCCWPGWPC